MNLIIACPYIHLLIVGCVNTNTNTQIPLLDYLAVIKKTKIIIKPQKIQGVRNTANVIPTHLLLE